MTAQNAAHACDCGNVKVTLLNKRNAAEALTAPLNGNATANFFKLSAGESPPRCGQ